LRMAQVADATPALYFAFLGSSLAFAVGRAPRAPSPHGFFLRSISVCDVTVSTTPLTSLCLVDHVYVW
jgi:hypothetical protein